jgi:hypothetical protein
LIGADRFCPPRRLRVSFGGGAERIIRRANMPSMRANDPSMMLEELEVDPDTQGMAKLLAYQRTPRQVISGSSVL